MKWAIEEWQEYEIICKKEAEEEKREKETRKSLKRAEQERAKNEKMMKKAAKEKEKLEKTEWKKRQMEEKKKAREKEIEEERLRRINKNKKDGKRKPVGHKKGGEEKQPKSWNEGGWFKKTGKAQYGRAVGWITRIGEWSEVKNVLLVARPAYVQKALNQGMRGPGFFLYGAWRLGSREIWKIVWI